MKRIVLIAALAAACGGSSHSAVDRNHGLVLHHPNGARNDRVRIVNDRSGLAPRRQRTVGFVGTIGEHLSGHSQPGGAARVQDF